MTAVLGVIEASPSASTAQPTTSGECSGARRTSSNNGTAASPADPSPWQPARRDDSFVSEHSASTKTLSAVALPHAPTKPNHHLSEMYRAPNDSVVEMPYRGGKLRRYAALHRQRTGLQLWCPGENPHQ